MPSSSSKSSKTNSEVGNRARRVRVGQISALAWLRQVIFIAENYSQAWSRNVDLLVKVDRIICNLVKSYVMINELG